MTVIAGTSIADLAQTVKVALTMSSSLAQLQQIGYAIHVFFTDCLGATVVASSNGVDTPTAADQITSTSSIKIGTPTVQDHTWVIYQLTDGVVTNWFKVEYADASGTADPRTIHIYRSQGAYDLAGLSKVTAPATSVGDRESACLTLYSMPWATGPTAGTISYQWSADEQIGWFMVKQTGSDSAAGFVIDRAEAGDTYADGTRDWLIATTGINAAAGWKNVFYPNGGSTAIGGYDGTAGSTIAGRAGAGAVTWTNGLPADGRVRLYPVKWVTDATDQEDRRCAGASRILRRPASNTATNDTDPQDDPADDWEWRVVVGGAVLWKKSDGALS